MKLVAIISCLAFLPLGVSATSKNVADYFLAIPTQTYTEGTPAEILEIIKRGEDGSILDTRNGYMRLSGDGAQVSLQIALFRFLDKTPLLVIAWGNLEEPDFTHLSFFREKNGKMIPEPRAILPVGDSEKHRFALPRFGRTILVENPEGKTLSKYTWNGQRFNMD